MSKKFVPAVTKRTVFHIIPFNKKWAVEVEGVIIDTNQNKQWLIWDHQIICVEYLTPNKVESQIVIHGRNGKIQKEYTYGNDPKITKG